MIFDKKQQKEFEEVSRPLMKFLNENCHPHVKVIIDSFRAELSEGITSFTTEDYIKD